MSLETNNVVGRVAKAIKFKHGVISSDIATKKAAYEQISSDFTATEEAAEIAFLQKYNQDDSTFQGQEEDALEQAEASINAMYDTIQYKTTTPELIDSLQEFNTQIESEKDAFILDRDGKASDLQTKRTAIEQAFGVVGDFDVPFPSVIPAVGMQAGLGA